MFPSTDVETPIHDVPVSVEQTMVCPPNPAFPQPETDFQGFWFDRRGAGDFSSAGSFDGVQTGLLVTRVSFPEKAPPSRKIVSARILPDDLHDRQRGGVFVFPYSGHEDRRLQFTLAPDPPASHSLSGQTISRYTQRPNAPKRQ